VWNNAAIVAGVSPSMFNVQEFRIAKLEGGDMRKTVLGSASAIAIALVTGGAAWAADVPMKAAPYAAAPLFDWSGWYFGANLGRVTGKIESNSDNRGNAIANNWRPGLQLGYNVQRGNVVWGIEGDVAIGKSKFNWSTFNDGSHINANGMGSIRGRLGWAFDRILVYGTGGIGNLRVKACSSAAADGCVKTSSWKPVVGVGLEGALTNNWILGAEYLWYLGSSKTLSAPLDDTVRFKDYQEFRVRLSYKFDWGGKGPVSAKY
jgi:outer membrane immunogenic protein